MPRGIREYASPPGKTKISGDEAAQQRGRSDAAAAEDVEGRGGERLDAGTGLLRVDIQVAHPPLLEARVDALADAGQLPDRERRVVRHVRSVPASEGRVGPRELLRGGRPVLDGRGPDPGERVVDEHHRQEVTQVRHDIADRG